MRTRNGRDQGFTLIELSIVLVIIGLIVGGVLVGQDLIKAAAVRAQISQIEKYNAAVNTFYVKYGYLPGDIPAGPASQFGFAARGQYAGEGDGNGLIEGNWGDCLGCNSGFIQGSGEAAMFWVDLSAAKLIDGSFSIASAITCAASDLTPTSSPNLGAYLPAAKIGGGNYVLVSSGDFYYPTLNLFQIMKGMDYPAGCGFFAYAPANYGLAVAQAYNIDKKIDDGLPGTGNVFMDLAEVGGFYSTYNGVAVAGTSTTCFDDGNSVGGKMQYSLSQNNGNGVNCTLSFKMQGAAR